MTTANRRAVHLIQLSALFPGDWTPARDGCPTAELAQGRYAAIVKSTARAASYWISTRDDRDEAAAMLNHEPDFWEPFAVLDLDTLEWSSGLPAVPDFSCAECGTTDAVTYVVTQLDREDPATRTEVCLRCHHEIAA